jgi:hypothetical protein
MTDVVIRWQDVLPADAEGIDLTKRQDITAPINEKGERCPWPWGPQTLTEEPIGIYGCLYCGARVVAGREHIDYAYVTPGSHLLGPEKRE